MKSIACAIYTRKSSEEGLDQSFNSLDAQREACAAFILSQKTQGWRAIPTTYDDGGFSGGNIERPALRQLLADVEAKRVQIIVVYKVDRLTRSLADFAKMVELFDAQGVSFVSVTQQFNTTSSMGRLTLNVLLSFAQFEREVTGERIRDKIAASKRKGLWMGGVPPIGYTPHERTLVIADEEAQKVRGIFALYLEWGCVRRLKERVDQQGWKTPLRNTRREGAGGGCAFSRGHLYRILSNPVYIGKIVHRDQVFDGQHPAIIDSETWQRVQAKLEVNQQGQRMRATASHPSILTGVVFDVEGHRLTPTHAQKGSRRYRYYVQQRGGQDAKEQALRVPAQQLEDAVLNAIAALLLDESRLLEWMGEAAAGDARAGMAQAKSLANRLVGKGIAISDQIDIAQRLIERVTVHSDRLQIAMRSTGLWPDGNVERELCIDVPIQIKRVGMAVRLVVHQQGAPIRRIDPKLVALVTKAHDWLTRLTSGRCDGIQALAEQEQIGVSYVRRVIYLGFLAPDIARAITRGAQPEGLSVETLQRQVPLPADWKQQRELLGFPPP